MGSIVRWGVVALAFGAFAFSGCTTKYQQLLKERDRELTALKDERSRLEVEVRSLRANEEVLKAGVKLAREESDRLKAELSRRRDEGAGSAGASGRAVDPDLVRLARQNGLRLEQRPEGVAVVLSSAVAFRSGSARLTEKGKRLLDGLARTIRRKFPTRTLSIEGHTDSTPIKRCKFGTNWRLSAERAESVRQYLARKGIGKKTRVRVVGYGPTAPIASNRRASGRRKNRRVELVILSS